MHKMQICKGKRELINAGLWSHSADIIFHPIFIFRKFCPKNICVSKKELYLCTAFNEKHF